MTVNGKKLGSDLKKAKAHRIRAREYEDLPQLTDDMLARGVLKQNGKRLGRPLKADKKVSVHLRIDPDVCAAFRSTGQGWQSRMHAVLREHMPQ